tara:strand:- start:584 stop:778 length:195 start_codon:yes stop_codon:yes gene_type:complete
MNTNDPYGIPHGSQFENDWKDQAKNWKESAEKWKNKYLETQKQLDKKDEVIEHAISMLLATFKE